MMGPESRGSKLRKRAWWSSLAVLAGWLVVAYFPIAYVIAPSTWRLFPQDRALASSEPLHAVTAEHLVADPINLKVMGSDEAIERALSAQGWTPADPITIKTSLLIALNSVLDRPYPDAPVSHLYLFGRPQDLAFQMEAHGGPRQRHHVRFWDSGAHDAQGRPIWYGAATYDQSVGVSHRTGQFTHHIAADVDRERDVVVRVLSAVPGSQVQWQDAYQPLASGRNGGGDPFHTDRRLAVVQLPSP